MRSIKQRAAGIMVYLNYEIERCKKRRETELKRNLRDLTSKSDLPESHGSELSDDIRCASASYEYILYFQLSQIENYQDLARILASSEARRIANSTVVTGGTLTLDEATRYIGMATNRGDPLAKVAGDLDTEQKTVRESLNNLKQQYQKIGSELDKSSSTTSSFVRQFLWPFILMTALGLKLARVPYWVAKSASASLGQ